MVVHLRRRGILVARLDGLDDPRVMDVDRAMEDPGSPERERLVCSAEKTG